jgi:hypothetical protein
VAFSWRKEDRELKLFSLAFRSGEEDDDGLIFRIWAAIESNSTVFDFRLLRCFMRRSHVNMDIPCGMGIWESYNEHHCRVRESNEDGDHSGSSSEEQLPSSHTSEDTLDQQ